MQKTDRADKVQSTDQWHVATWRVWKPQGRSECSGNILCVDIAGKAVLGRVGKIDRFCFVLKAVHNSDRAKDLFAGDTHAGLCTGNHGGFEPGATALMARTSGGDARTLCSSIIEQGFNLVDRGFVYQWALFYLVFSAARSRSASSNTMKGALPPSSIETFLTVSAHCASSVLPTAVEPVKVSFLTSGLLVSSLPIACGCPVTMLMTPAGTRKIPRCYCAHDTDR